MLQCPAGLGENSRNVLNSSLETRLMELCRAASGQIPISVAEGWRLLFTDGAWLSGFQPTLPCSTKEGTGMRWARVWPS